MQRASIPLFVVHIPTGSAVSFFFIMNHPIPARMRIPIPMSMKSIVLPPLEGVLPGCPVEGTAVLVVAEEVETENEPPGKGLGGIGFVGALVGGTAVG